MELKTKYQYTYFIKSFLINPSKYNKYMLGLLKNGNWKLKIFEKQRDLNLYTYFLQDVRDYFFPSFNYDKAKKRELDEMSIELRANALAKLPCNIFEYNMEKQIKCEVEDENAIPFDIEKIELMCFDTGICFLVIKTTLEDNESFLNVLDFNVKFKDVNSDYYKLKIYNNIRIQTDNFINMKEFSKFIDSLIGAQKSNIIDDTVDLYNKRFFTYSYVCIDQKDWNDTVKFEDIQDEFYKLNNAVSSRYTPNFDKEESENETNAVLRWEYAKFGFTKQSGCLMCSNIDIRNYTEFPFEFENEYLYTLLMRLYQRMLLNKINIGMSSKLNKSKQLKSFSKFAKEVWRAEITNSETGCLFYEKWGNVFELEELYTEAKLKYEVICKDMEIDNNFKNNKLVNISLAISLFLNVINLIYWLIKEL